MYAAVAYGAHSRGVAHSASASASVFDSDTVLQSRPRIAKHSSPFEYADARNAHQQEEEDAALSELLNGPPASIGSIDRLSLGGGIDTPSRTLGGFRARLSLEPTPTSPHLSRPSTPAVAAASGGIATPAHAHAPFDEVYYNLLKCAREGDCAGVKALLHSPLGAQLDVNYADRDGDTSLHRACAGGHLQMCHLLVLEHSADIHRTNKVCMSMHT
jgi:ankyrin repeat protein